MNKENIFNFISNSYSKFLTCYSNTASSIEQVTNDSHLDTLRHSFHLHHSIYSMQKKQAHRYRFIFFGFSFLFFVLGSIVCLNTTNWACNIYFKYCAFVKITIYTLCFLFSAITFLIGYIAKPEQDTAQHLFDKMKSKLKELHKYRQKEVGVFGAFQEEKRIKRLFFQQSYSQALDKMHEHKEQALHLLEKIRSSEIHSAVVKEKLVNQSLLEFQTTLQSILHAFQQKSYLLALRRSPNTSIGNCSDHGSYSIYHK